jgi:hypothetical protein
MKFLFNIIIIITLSYIKRSNFAKKYRVIGTLYQKIIIFKL